MKPYRQFLILIFATNLAFAFSFSTYVMFLLSKGVSLFEVGLINIFFMVAIALAEIPTGVFADLLGRKISFLISCLLTAAGLFIYFSSSNFWLFVTAEIMAGIGITFKSGALDAWVVDSVVQSGEKITNERIFSSAGIARNSAYIVGGLAGGYIGNVNLAYPWLAGGIVLCLTFIWAAFTMKEPYALTHIKAKSPFLAFGDILKRSLTYGLKKRVVLYLMSAAFILSFLYQPLNMYWQPQFSAKAGGEIWVLGWVSVLIFVSLMLGSILVKMIPPNWGRSKVLAALVALNSLPIIIAALMSRFWPMLALFCTYEISRGMLEPIRISFINNEIPSSERATILSLDQVFMRLGAILGLFITGLIADHASISASWAFAAIVGLAAIPLFWVCKPSGKSLPGSA